MNNWNFKHFKKKEFTCKCGCGFNIIDLGLVDTLNRIRDKTKRRMDINSGCRCNKHNIKEGGKRNSSHKKGLAVDIKCITPKHRLLLLPYLVKHFDRVFIYKRFIHVDIDSTKPKGIYV